MVQKKSTTRKSKSAASKRTAPIKTARRSTKSNMKSFKLAKEPRPFMSTVFSDDTLHWVIIGGLVVTVALVTATMQIRINDLYNQVDALMEAQK